MGTVYSVPEIEKIAAFAHTHKMLLHMDGARLANAAVSLNLPFKAFTTAAGVDVLSFGGTKNGMMYGEAVCFLTPGLSKDFRYIRKQSMQLASKMRFIAAQYIGYFHDELWKKNASHSNSMAQLLAGKVNGIGRLKITQPVQSNAVFIILPKRVAKALLEYTFFYPWDEKRSEYRWMTSWDTSEADIEHLIKRLKTELKK
jgi:threonine aldolase